MDGDRRRRLGAALLAAVNGMLEIRGYGDCTTLLRAPVWRGYVPTVLGTGLSALVAVYMVVSDLRPAMVNRGEEI